MKEETHIGEITFDNIIQLKELLEEAWNRGKLEQSTLDLKKEKKSYLKLAKKLGVKDINVGECPQSMGFQEWFLEMVKQITVK